MRIEQSHWCRGDIELCDRVARTWPLERIAKTIGKTPEQVLERYPDAGRPATFTDDEHAAIKRLLPGRGVAKVAALIGRRADEVAHYAKQHELLTTYQAADASMRRASTLRDRQAAIRMRKDGVRAVDIATALCRNINTISVWTGTVSTSRQYTSAEDAYIIEATERGETSGDIGRHLGRAPPSIRGRLRRLRKERA